MQVTVETTEGLERQLTITVPAANIEDAVTAELKKIAKIMCQQEKTPTAQALSVCSRDQGAPEWAQAQQWGAQVVGKD